MKRSAGFTLIELVLVVAALSVLGGVVATTTVGLVRDANVEATAQGVELLAQWRSQVAIHNRQPTTDCWNSARLTLDCPGGGSPDAIPSVLNEGKPMFWPQIRAPWSNVCDQKRYPDHYRRIAAIVGSCNPNWTYPVNTDMSVFVLNFPQLQIQ